MKLVNETQQVVGYSISTSTGMGDCGSIEVDGVADLPQWDQQVDVTVSFLPIGGEAFQITVDDTHTGEQVEMAVVAE